MSSGDHFALSPLDYFALAAYFAILCTIGYLAGRRAKNNAEEWRCLKREYFHRASRREVTHEPGELSDTRRPRHCKDLRCEPLSMPAASYKRNHNA